MKRYSTRTIKKEEHGEPHFEEAFFLRVIPDDADEHDSIRLTLWDSLGSGDIADELSQLVPYVVLCLLPL